MLNDVPGDIVIAVLEVLYQLVEEYGWRSYLKIHPRPCYGYAKTFISWSARDQLRLRAVGDTNWRDKEFVARPLSQRWVSKLQPILSINPSRLILAAGSHIYTYDFHPSPSARHAAPVKPECTYVTTMLHPSRDITSMVSVPDGDNDRTIFVGYADGALERLVLPSKSKTHETPFAIRAPEECHNLHNGGILESLSVSSNHLLSLSASGKAGLLSLNSLDRQHTSINLGYRSWCGYLSMGSSSPFAAFGTTSPHAFSTHNIYSSHIDPRASVYLSPGSHLSTTSAVYAIVRAPPSSPWGASHQIIVSGWYDGLVHVHDLRSSSRTPSSNDHSIPSLLPTLTLADPWSYEPIYSLCSGGGSDAHVVAGSARHSVLAFWDVRSPNFGWSVHAPGNDSSPVYSVVMDGSRVFGANESRGFVLDFGGGVMEDTYPPIAHDPVPTATNRNWRRGRVGSAGGDATLKKDTTNGPGFYVTKYNHGKL